MQEPKPIGLKNANLPKLVGSLMHSNQFLKTFSVFSLFAVILSIVTVLFDLNKEPLVITLSENGSVIQKTELPKPEDEIQKGIKHYLERRYQWEPSDVLKKLKESEDFITPQAKNAFQNAVANIGRFSTEKQVSQKVYPERIEIDLTKQIAIVTGDRITTIQGLKAAGGLKLELTFEYGPRSTKNPWGLYISKEREE